MRTRRIAVFIVSLGLMSEILCSRAHAQTCGDVDQSGNVAATDALMVLQKAVGLGIANLYCSLPSTGQTTSFGEGDDGDRQMGAARAYRDNGDGTITDLHTGLMWEKKIALDGLKVLCSNEAGSCANPHDADNTYTWSTNEPNFDGGIKTIFLEQMNNRCSNSPSTACNSNADCAGGSGPCGFAGHRDWRLPNFYELLSIQHLENLNPRADPVFQGDGCGSACTDITAADCSCTFVAAHATSSTIIDANTLIWLGNFGGSADFHKTAFQTVRAVRGGRSGTQ